MLSPADDQLQTKREDAQNNSTLNPKIYHNNLALFTRIYFRVECNIQDVAFNSNNQVVVVGDSVHLGEWKFASGHPLITTEDLGPCWFSAKPVYLPLKQTVNYRYAVVDSDYNLIQFISNPMGTDSDPFSFTVIPTGISMTVEDDNGSLRYKTISDYDLNHDRSESESQIVMDPRQKNKSLVEKQIKILEELRKDPVILSTDTVLIVSFELPLKVYVDAEGNYNIISSKSSWLPSMYNYRERMKPAIKFIGYPGCGISDPSEQAIVRRLLEPLDCIPVFLSSSDLDEFLQFCHVFLWPLFHNVFTLDDRNQKPFKLSSWSTYQLINRLYTNAIVSSSHESDSVWVNDYHLALVPMFLRRKLHPASVGFFLHVPFPSSEVFRWLPVRDEVLRSLLCCDLIGFHFYEYAWHFLVCCKRILGLDYHFKLGGAIGINYCGSNVIVKIGHLHIEYKDLCSKYFLPLSDIIQQKANALRQRYAGRYIFCGLDRCDRLSGLLLKIRAFKHFLNNYPYAQGKVVLIQYVYPCVSYWNDSGELRNELSELAGHINRLFMLTNRCNDECDSPLVNNAPHIAGDHIELHLSEISTEDKLALFYASDCFLDTSMRGGLNVNPFEFICSHHNRPAQIVLSEFTGSSRALVSIRRCNPWKLESISEQLDLCFSSHHCLASDNSQLFYRDQSYLASNSGVEWMRSFVSELYRTRRSGSRLYMHCGFGNTFRVLQMDSDFRSLDTSAVINGLKASKNRVFFLDYEGTLAPDRRRITSFNEEESLFSQGAYPSECVKSCLSRILQDHRNTVIILSGRSPNLLETWFGDIEGIGLCAEHGYYFKVPCITGDKWQMMAIGGVTESSEHIEKEEAIFASDLPDETHKKDMESNQIQMSWKRAANELMFQYVMHTQGSFIENKGSALVFQFRDSDPDHGAMQAKELSNYLCEMLFTYPVTVVSGKGYVEVRLRGVNKGNAVKFFMSSLTSIKGEIDFVLCIGDDRSDEDMFAVIQNSKLDLMTKTQSGGNSVKKISVDLCDLQSLNSDFSASKFCETVDFKDPPPPHERFFTCTVGKKPSKARFYVNSSEEVSELLDDIKHFVQKGLHTVNPGVRQSFVSANLGSFS